MTPVAGKSPFYICQRLRNRSALSLADLRARGLAKRKKERVSLARSHRDVPYGWEVAMENVTDPAHVAVSHHNIVANRYTDPKPLSLEFVRKPTNKDGFAFRTGPLGLMLHPRSYHQSV